MEDYKLSLEEFHEHNNAQGGVIGIQTEIL